MSRSALHGRVLRNRWRKHMRVAIGEVFENGMW